MVFELQFEKTNVINDINIVEVGDNKYEVMCKEFIRERPILNLHIKNDHGKYIASTDKRKKLPRITNSSLESVIFEFNQTRNHNINIKNVIDIKRENAEAVFLVL